MLDTANIKHLVLFFLLIFSIGCRGGVPPEAPTAEPVVINELLRPSATIPPLREPQSTAMPTQTPSPTSPPALTPLPTPSPTVEVLFPPYAGDPLATELIGIQVHIHRENLLEIFAHLAELRVGWVKVQVSWKLYEPAPGQYAPDRLTELDQFISLAQQQGIAVLLGIAKAPEWSRPTTELDGPPADFELFRGFTNFLSARYAGRVAAYELWNEMNLQREWNGRPLNAAEFARLAALGAAGIRAADSAAIIVAGAPAPTGINDGVTAIDDREFFVGMVAAGLGADVDAFGIHPYGWANPPSSDHTNPDSAVSSHNNHPSFFFLDTIIDYQRILELNGVTKPLWATEFGWGSFDNIFTANGRAVVPPAGVEFMRDVSEWQQAQYIQEALAIGQKADGIGPMFLWNLNFGPLLGTEYSETGFSILRPDGAPRPAYHAIAGLPRS